MTTNTCELSTISTLDLDNVTGGVNWGEVGRRAVSCGGAGATGGAVAGAVVGSMIGRVGGAIAGAGSAIYDTWNQ